MRLIVPGIGLALVLAAPAFGQTTSTNQTTSPPTTGSISPQGQDAAAPLKQKVEQNLSKAGFTDIKIMPESFLVRAKDPNGNPMLMVINPDSVSAVTYAPNSTSNPDATANPAAPSNNHMSK